MTYTTKKCPHCRYIYVNHSTEDQRKYGCPILVCEQCNKPFFDKDIKEPALYGYNNFHEIINKICTWLFGILLIPLGLYMLCTTIPILPYNTFYGFIGILIGLFFLFKSFTNLWSAISEIINKDKIAEELQTEYDKSINRLKNDEYLSLLSKYDRRAQKLLKERTAAIEEHYAKPPMDKNA